MNLSELKNCRSLYFPALMLDTGSFFLASSPSLYANAIASVFSLSHASRDRISRFALFCFVVGCVPRSLRQSCGLPIFCMKKSSFRDLIENAVNGFNKGIFDAPIEWPEFSGCFL